MNFFFNLSTKAKLMTSFLIVILINAVLVFNVIIALSNVGNTAAVIDDILTHSFQRVYNIQKSVTSLNVKFASGLNNLDERYPFQQLRQDAPSLIENVRRATSALNVNYLQYGDFPKIAQSMLDSTETAISLLESEIEPLVEQNKINEALQIYLRDVYPHVTKVFADAANIFDIQTDYCAILAKDAADPTTMWVATGLALLASIVAVFLALFMSNYISKALSLQIAVINKLAGGDFDAEIKSHAKDEFGHSHDVLREMRDTLNKILYMTKRECAQLRDKMVALQSLENGIVESSNAIQNQATTVAAAANEMVATTQDIARNCESAAAGSNLCRQITISGVNKVEEAVQNIRQQSEHTRDNATKIESLAKQTHDIGSIVSTIDDIAAQTNLLALNAAIEAARAGEAGRGFAVVADEVRALASRTTKSTQEISKMVKNIQDEAKIATDSINASVENMDTVAGDAQNIMNILNEITSHVAEVNSQITQIATAAEQQTAATAEISSHMQTVSSSSQEMADSSQSANQTLHQAHADLGQLNDALSFFKTREVSLAGVNDVQ